MGQFNEITQLDLSHNPNLKLVEASNLAAAMNWINLKNGNNNPDMEIRLSFSMPTTGNSNVVCVMVDDENLALNDQLPYSEWNVFASYGAQYNYSGNCALSTQHLTINSHTFIHPNPVSEVLYIKDSLGEVVDNVFLYDASGRLVIQCNNVTKGGIDVSNLAKGMYLVKINKGAKSSSQKLIVQ